MAKSPYEQKHEQAVERLKNVLSGGPLLGIHLSISRGHSIEWGPPLNPGWFGIPDGNRKFVVAPATISIDSWLALQNKAGGSGGFGRFIDSAYDETVQKAKTSVKTGRYDIPSPVLVIKQDGSIPQEGRSRAVGARRAGASKVPIWVAAQVYR